MTLPTTRDAFPAWFGMRLPEHYDEQPPHIQAAHAAALLDIPIDAVDFWQFRVAALRVEIDDLIEDTPASKREEQVESYWRLRHAKIAARTAQLLENPRRHEECRTCPPERTRS